MDEHCEHLHDIAALVLNCTDDEDCTALRAHMEKCPECWDAYIHHFEVMEKMVNDCPSVEPSAGCKERVMKEHQSFKIRITRFFSN